eukprot:UN19840
MFNLQFQAVFLIYTFPISNFYITTYSCQFPAFPYQFITSLPSLTSEFLTFLTAYFAIFQLSLSNL